MSKYKYFCETFGKVDHALVHSVARCDSYWFMILHLWEAESAFCALCAVSVLPRVFLSVSSVAQKILRFAQDDSWMLRMTVRRSVLHVIRSVTAVMLSGAKHLSHHSAPLSFRPSTFHCYFDRAERVEKSICCAAPSSEYAASDDYSSGAVGSSILKGSPRAWLLPSMKCYILWTPNALTINYLTINTVGQKHPPC